MRTQPHERRDISPAGFALLAGSYAGIVAVGALVAFGVQKLLLHRWTKAEAAIPAVVNTLPPEPRLESENSAQLEKLHAEEDRLLSGYAWVDRARGKARIPLERAIDLALEKGFPEAGGRR